MSSVTTVEWNEPGAMAEYDAYYNGYYLEVYSLDDGNGIYGWRWEVRHEDEWPDPEPFAYGIVSTLDQAKNDAKKAAF